SPGLDTERFALKRCRHAPACAHVGSTHPMVNWLGGGQSKRSAGFCSAKHDARDFACLLFSSAERSVPERAGWFQAAARSHFCFDRVGNRWGGVTRAVYYRLFSARSHAAAKRAEPCF